MLRTNWCSGSWNTTPIRATRSAERHSCGSAASPAPAAPPLSSAVAARLPAWAGSSPARVSSSVDFPAPVGSR
ncbi:hypothetical protein BG28_12395 [Nesterenkonia sp. AN1]|nr:hypothetical protein BG28_12395 [Nesterenkonia sp. AN1]